MAKTKIPNFTLPAVYQGKPCQIKFELDHDVIHNTKGNRLDQAFYKDLSSKLDKVVPTKSELTEIDGIQTNGVISIYGWNDEILTNISDLIFFCTHNLGYDEIPSHPLNPAGVTITFESTD